MFLKYDEQMANDKFVSIMVMSFFRPEMTLELLKSIHKLADFPFEVILHDDHSDEWVQNKIYNEMRSLCSTVVLGQGNVNLGFASAANRGTALCNSDYVLLLNNDCLISKPCFKMIKEVLDTPYIASMSPREIRNATPGAADSSRAVVHRNGHSFSLSNLPGGSGAFAYRKACWFENGGFPQVYDNGGDIAFIFSLIKRGYFHAGWMISTDGDDAPAIRNIDFENKYINATAGIRNFNEAYPRIFPYCHQSQEFAIACELRRQRRYPLSQEQYLAPRGHHNIDYWSKWADSSYDGKGGINWEVLEDFGQRKWREQIDADIQAWKSLKV
ncbi:hypothetical protein LCGC14_2431670 [marine sediment metagenome]|uniref:Glycosyltransferase 2-like domain-containing protein n=1 Tax=marine sediment metagenome TaxID=412755 RepID=A0A0F9EFQ1_9ZZZZ